MALVIALIAASSDRPLWFATAFIAINPPQRFGIQPSPIHKQRPERHRFQQINNYASSSSSDRSSANATDRERSMPKKLKKKKQKAKKGNEPNNRRRKSYANNRFDDTPPVPLEQTPIGASLSNSKDVSVTSESSEKDDRAWSRSASPKNPTSPTPTASAEIVESAKLYFSSPTIRKRSTNPMIHYTVIQPTPSTHYRTQIRLTASRRSAWGRPGCVFHLYRSSTPQTTNSNTVPDSEIHHPAINRAIAVLEAATENVATSSFDPESGYGGLRYVQLRVERGSGKVCLTLVWNSENVKGCQPGLSRLTKEIKRLDPTLWRSVWCHTNNSLGDALVARSGGDKKWHRLVGAEFIKEVIPGSEPGDKEGLLHFSPDVFRHGNQDGIDEIAKRVAELVPEGSKVCELYSGVGILGLTTLAYHARNGRKANEYDDWWEGRDGGGFRSSADDKSLLWIRCNDDNPANQKCFGRTVSSMPSEVTGVSPRAKKYKKNFNGRNKNDTPAKEMTLKEMMAQMQKDTSSSSSRSTTDNEKVTFTLSSAAKAVQDGRALGADVLLLSPPPKGIDPDVLNQLCKPHDPTQEYAEDLTSLAISRGRPRYAINMVNNVETLIYVSCAFDSLARDCDRLLKGGSSGWKLESVEGYVLFPGSNHVETLALFKRDLRKGGEREIRRDRREEGRKYW